MSVLPTSVHTLSWIDMELSMVSTIQAIPCLGHLQHLPLSFFFLAPATAPNLKSLMFPTVVVLEAVIVNWEIPSLV